MTLTIRILRVVKVVAQGVPQRHTCVIAYLSEVAEQGILRFYRLL